MKKILKNSIILSIILTIIIVGTNASFGQQNVVPGKNRVSYLSQGEKVVAFLFIPPNYKEGEKKPAIVLVPPATGVKEQTIGLYAEELSKKGFVTLAFDPRGFGESEGHPLLQDPYRIADDIKNSVSFLHTLDQVDTTNIFNMGICMGAGFAAYTTAYDSRVKALAVVSPFLDATDNFLNTVGSTTARKTLIAMANTARQRYYETGEDIMRKVVPETEEEMKVALPIAIGMREYYLPGKPGDVPNWKNAQSWISIESLLSFSIFNFTHMFESVPTYVVYGDKAVSADGAIKFYDDITGEKEKLVFEGAGHFDLYWMPEYVDPAVEGISAFFNKFIK